MTTTSSILSSSSIITTASGSSNSATADATDTGAASSSGGSGGSANNAGSGTPVASYASYADELAAASNTLMKMQLDFQSRYQYKVLGQDDALFLDVAAPAQTGDANFSTIKDYRTSELIAQSRIDASSAGAADKLRQTAVSQLDFVNNSLSNVNDIAAAATPGDGSSHAIVTSVSALADHLLEAVNNYAAAVDGGATDPQRDAGFIEAAKTARFSLLQLSVESRSLLASDNVIYNRSAFELGGKLDSIMTALDNIAAGDAAASSPAPSSSSSNSSTSSSAPSSAVDITV
ncbi:MAG: hypothetical protein GC185_01650 [Alphaproteobacteria bacterium]|nr:hypothetical protein [Alphaproteobacteria bacterium]